MRSVWGLCAGRGCKDDALPAVPDHKQPGSGARKRTACGWSCPRARRGCRGRRPRGWRVVRLYHPEEFAIPVPLLWVYAGGASDHVGVAVSVLATSGGTWAYHEAQRGRRGYLFPCGDAKAAADQVDNLLKHRMFPGTW